ncbi:unnamed protein product [Amoebophrya sp. A25]|nr:unnamed protein product [Amoebophrya sp. A25]|eukprot:GSA25T00002498001.1
MGSVYEQTLELARACHHCCCYNMFGRFLRVRDTTNWFGCLASSTLSQWGESVVSCSLGYVSGCSSHRPTADSLLLLQIRRGVPLKRAFPRTAIRTTIKCGSGRDRPRGRCAILDYRCHNASRGQILVAAG